MSMIPFWRLHHPGRALLRERPRPALIRAWPQAWWLAVATVCFGAFMGQLDASVVTLTYRPVQAQYHSSLAAVQWVSLVYLLTLVALLLPAGRISDRRGRKLLYLYGFALFSVGSLLCGLAPSLPALIGFRVLQAVGAAMLQANSVALVTASAPQWRLRSALGVQAAAQALGLAAGPTLGGLLVTTLGWRWVYFVNLPVGAMALVCGYYLLPRSDHLGPPGRAGPLGSTLLVASSAALLLGLSAISGLGVPPWTAAALLAAALGSGAGFIVHERHARQPVVDLSLLRRPVIGRGLIGALGGYLVLFGPLVMVPVVLTADGLSALHAGLVATAVPAGFALAALGTNGVLPAAWTDRRRCSIGASLCVAAFSSAALAPLRPGWMLPLLAVVGLGLGTAIPANNALIMRAVPTAAFGTGGGLVNLARGMGTALGVALVTLCLHLGATGDHHRGGRLALAMLAAASLLMLSAGRTDRTPETEPAAPERASRAVTEGCLEG